MSFDMVEKTDFDKICLALTMGGISTFTTNDIILAGNVVGHAVETEHITFIFKNSGEIVTIMRGHLS